MNKVLNVSNVCLQYQSKEGEVAALDGISFSVCEGEFVSIVGPSGCGKSTLLSVLCGLLPPSSGSVTLQGEPVIRPGGAIGLMPQRDSLFAWRTVLDNVLLGLQIQRRLTAESSMYARSLLHTYGLGDFCDSYPDQLSGGMRQRAALIRTLATKPSVLLLDEPFGALDYQTRLTVSDDVHRILKQQRKTALMVTHDLSEALSVSDRILVLSRRPATVKAIFTPAFGDCSPLERRDHPAFRTYFHEIWRELDANA